MMNIENNSRQMTKTHSENIQQLKKYMEEKMMTGFVLLMLGVIIFASLAGLTAVCERI